VNPEVAELPLSWASEQQTPAVATTWRGIGSAMSDSSADTDRRRLGIALGQCAEECCDAIEARLARHRWAGRAPSATYLERSRHTRQFGILLMARWLVSALPPDDDEMLWISSRGELAAAETIAVVNLVRTYLVWRDVVIEAIVTESARLKVASPVRDEAIDIVRRSCDASLTRTGAAFDAHTDSLRARLEDEGHVLRYLALHDSLTGLSNRVALYERLDEAILLSRSTGTPCSVLLIDLDGFKQINDTFGHRVGDICLQEAAGRLAGVLRASDTLARFGGDEFVAVLPGAGLAAAEDAAARMSKVLQEAINLGVTRVTLRASIGISTYPDVPLEPGALLIAADAAMYRVKGRRPNRRAVALAQIRRPAPPRVRVRGAARG
jgi:diguanylate cyclase (GGDEF)-like protein